LNFQLAITPEPDTLYPLLAASGDEILRARFLGSTDRFLVRANSEVITQTAPALSMCLEANPPLLPYPVGHLNGDLMGALEGWLPNGQHDPAAVDLAQEALTGCDQMAVPFLNQLVAIIQDRVKYTQRHMGPAWPAGRTLKERVGSCRDLAMLMIESCRCVGLPSRFVSGYHLVEPKPKEYDLHAWAEIYLPGAGWRGYDPSGKGLIDDRYIVLATSSKAHLTAAVSGSFSGANPVESELKWTIQAEVLDPGSSAAQDEELDLGRAGGSQCFSDPPLAAP
jgi:transglutaminase-like putative cysteine protease